MDDIGGFLCFLALCHSASTLQLTGPSVHAARLGSDACVPCLFTVDNPHVDPENLRIFWIFQDKEILSYDKTVRKTSSRYSLNTKVIGTGVANLTISNIQISDGGMYKCLVTYRSERKEKEIRLDIGAPPQVMITGNTVVMNKKSVLSCSITGFYPIDIDIRWFRDEQKMENNVMVGDPRKNLDKTYNVISTLTITPTEEDRKRIFSCRVRHEYLQEPLQKDFYLVYEEGISAGIIAAIAVSVSVVFILILAGVLWSKKRSKENKKLSDPHKSQFDDQRKHLAGEVDGPLLHKHDLPDLEIGEITIPTLTEGKNARLECTLHNYIPGVHTVKWFQKKREYDEPIPLLKDPRRRVTTKQGSDDQHTYTSCLHLTPVTGDDRVLEYICRVKQPNSGLMKEKSTGRLNETGSSIQDNWTQKMK